MNQYVTEDYYSNTFEGTTLPDSEIEKYLKLAQEKIDYETKNRIVYEGFNNLTEFQQDRIRKAICYQAEYYYSNGINSLQGVSGYSVLDVSINVDKSALTDAQKNDMDEFAYMKLSETGLTSRSFRWR